MLINLLLFGSEEDQRALFKLTQFLDRHTEYDGATETTTMKRGEGFDKAKESLQQSACRFLVTNVNWTMI